MKISSAYKQRLAKVVRFATAGAMVVSSLGVSLVTPAAAAPLTANSILLSNTRVAGTGGKYTISFKNTTATAIAQVNVEFCTTANSFGTGCTPATGLSVDSGTIAANGTAAGFGNDAGASAGTFASGTTNTISFVPTTPATEGAAMTHTLVIDGSITNPSAANTYYVRVKTYSDAGSIGIDEGTSAFAIVQSVIVSGRVLESMTFTVAGQPVSTTCGTGGDVSNIETTPATVPFGNFASGSPRIGCQTVKTSTNALTGFTTTVQRYVAGASPIGGMCRQTATLCTTDGGSSGVATSDTIVDAVLTTSPATWTVSTFGVGVNANGAETATLGYGAKNYRSLFDTVPVSVATKTGPSTGVDTYVTYQADVSSVQTAGVYQNRLVYVSTPIF